MVGKAVESLPEEWAAVDVLINNAGLARGLSRLHEGRPDDWEEMIDTNIKGLLHLTRALVPGMVRRGRGEIVNIGSIAGHEVYPKGHVYCASKFAVRALSQGLRMDLVDTPLKVTEIAPGMVRTEFSLVRFRGDEERAARTYSTFQPLDPLDVAETVLFCLTRPAHVSINQVVIMPTAQASIMVHNP
jgi:NADP-dependent 3-hydroxy acid dehydrogenase YdfG